MLYKALNINTNTPREACISTFTNKYFQNRMVVGFRPEKAAGGDNTRMVCDLYPAAYARLPSPDLRSPTGVAAVGRASASGNLVPISSLRKF